MSSKRRAAQRSAPGPPPRTASMPGAWLARLPATLSVADPVLRTATSAACPRRRRCPRQSGIMQRGLPWRWHSLAGASEPSGKELSEISGLWCLSRVGSEETPPCGPIPACEVCRAAKRYATDLTDSEFADRAVAAAALPARPAAHPDLRAVLDAIFYLLRTGCQWGLLPTCFPPRSTVFGYFRRWWRDGTLLGLYYALLVPARRPPVVRRSRPPDRRQPVGQDHRKRRPARL